MLYASTKDALKSAFGPEYVAEDVHVTSKEDILGKSSSVEASSRDNEDLLSTSEKNIREAVCGTFPLPPDLCLSCHVSFVLVIDSPGGCCPQGAGYRNEEGR